MLNNMGFYDLCVNVDDNSKKLSDCLTRLYELGYGTVALNRIIDESVFASDQKSKKKFNVDGPLKSFLENLGTLRENFSEKLVILSRLTFVYGDSSKTYLLPQLSTYKEFDLVGVVPTTQDAFQFACSQVTADIITLSNRSFGIKITRKLYMQAIERGVHFEIQYSNLIDPNQQRIALQQSHMLYIFGKSRNVIVSSGAKNASMLRNPYDIINLGGILGLTESRAKAAVLEQCRYLLSRAEGRRYGKAVFGIEIDVESEQEET